MLSFDFTEVAFRGKSDADLGRSVVLFRILSKPILVSWGSQLASLALKLGLPVKGLIRKTIFKQFVGGETRESSLKTIEWLAERKVGSILDYSVEGKDTDQGFEKTTNEIISCIQMASQQASIPLAVFKISGLVTQVVLERQSITPDNTEPSWITLKQRLRRIFQTATELNVPVMIDAEESWLQPAIDRLAEEAFEEFNKEWPVVFTTLQMYRKDRLQYLKELGELAVQRGFIVGVKLVRGAYMEKERNRAKELSYPDPIQPTKLETDRDFNLALEFLVDRIEFCALVLGTHNEESCYHLVKKMKDHGLVSSHPRVYFSQLLGMSDHISFNLAEAGYNVAKYVPYGPVAELLPYLQRRATENTSVKGQTGRELTLLYKEFARRRALNG